MRIFHFTMKEMMFGVLWVVTALPSILFLRNYGGDAAYQTEVRNLLGFHGLMASASIVYVVVALLLWKHTKKVSAPITALLQEMGFRFLPWKARRKFGDGKGEITEDPSGFSLVERPRGYRTRVSYQARSDPAGIGVLDQEDRLVELYNSGEIDFRDQQLLCVTVETPWTIWSSESGRDKEKRPRSLHHVKGDPWMPLILVYLGTRDSSTSRWMEERGLSRVRIFEGLLPEASQGLEPFDSGHADFDDFFCIRNGGPKVRALLTKSPETDALVAPLRQWRGALYDFHVAERIEAWIDVRSFKDWNELGEQLPKLIEDLTSFASRLDAILLQDTITPG